MALQDVIINARLGVTAVRYDAADIHYLGGADVTRTTVTVMKASGVASLEDAKHKEVLVGASGKSGQNFVVPTVLNSLLGTKFRIVLGYRGITDVNLAMERGEVHGHAVSWPVIGGTKRDWIEKNLIASLWAVAAVIEQAGEHFFGRLGIRSDAAQGRDRHLGNAHVKTAQWLPIIGIL